MRKIYISLLFDESLEKYLLAFSEDAFDTFDDFPLAVDNH